MNINHNPNFKAAVALALIGTLMAACGAAQSPASAPKSESAVSGSVASSTTAPAAAAAAPAAEAKSVNVSESLRAALAASALTVSYEVRVENVFGDAADGKESVMLSSTEAIDGARSDVTASAAIDGAAGSQRYLIESGKLYVKGPALALGAPEDAWYIASNEQANAYMPKPLPSEQMRKLLGDLLASPAELDAQALSQGSEQLDGMTCSAYALDQAGSIAKKDVAESRSVFGSIDKAEFKLLICSDGLPHLIRARYDGKGRGAEAKPASAQVEIRMSQFGAASAIVIPADAKPLLAPGEGAIRAPVEKATTAVKASAPEAAASGALTNSNDGSYGVDYPLVGKIKDLVKLDDSQDMVNYETDTPMQQVYEFYQSELTAQGLKEVPILTVFSDTTFSSVFEGLPDGHKVVVQVVINKPGSTNVNVSKRKM